MKKYVTIMMFIFWAVVVAIMTAGLVFYQNNKIGNSGTTNSGVTKTSPINIPAEQSITLAQGEIAKHISINDCWMIVNGKVYDVTSVINSHPGGASTITPYCGKEATSAFQTKNIGNNHSGSAYSWLDQLLLGTVGQTITGGTVQKLQSNPPTPTTSGRGNDD